MAVSQRPVYPKNSAVVPSQKPHQTAPCKTSTTATTGNRSQLQPHSTREKAANAKELPGNSSPSKTKATQEKAVCSSSVAHATDTATAHTKSPPTTQKPEEKCSLFPKDSLSSQQDEGQKQPHRSPVTSRRESLLDTSIIKPFNKNQGDDSPPRLKPPFDSRVRSNSSTDEDDS